LKREGQAGDSRPALSLHGKLVDAGVTALLFGAGADGCTVCNDEMQDGITNPASIDGNDAPAQYADDDGGYLRARHRTITRPVPSRSLPLILTATTHAAYLEAYLEAPFRKDYGVIEKPVTLHC